MENITSLANIQISWFVVITPLKFHDHNIWGPMNLKQNWRLTLINRNSCSCIRQFLGYWWRQKCWIHSMLLRQMSVSGRGSPLRLFNIRLKRATLGYVWRFRLFGFGIWGKGLSAGIAHRNSCLICPDLSNTLISSSNLSICNLLQDGLFVWCCRLNMWIKRKWILMKTGTRYET